jgi:hypothetical protein
MGVRFLQFNRAKKRMNPFALFLRYGFFVLFLLILGVLLLLHTTRQTVALILGPLLCAFGIYFLLGNQFRFRHLYLAMHEIYYMNKAYNGRLLDRDIKLTGHFFAILGLVGTIAVYFGL